MSLIYETPGRNAQEILIVGIGYRVDPDRLRGLVEWGAWRTRDLTPVRREEAEQSMGRNLASIPKVETPEVQTGGAQAFLRCISEEVIPFVERNYRVYPTGRGLAGYSFGGLFALYALFQAPDTFTRMFCGSPSMWEDLFGYEKAYASRHDDLKASLLLTAGSHETETVERVTRMTERLGSRGYPGLEIQAHIFEDEGHVSAGAAAISRALSVLYYQDSANG